MFTRPKPRRTSLRIDAITRDPRLQLRVCPPGLTCDDATAALYAERMEQGEVFPPLEVVCEERKNKEPIYWLFSGFTRFSAYQRRGVNSVEVIVYTGTFKDAEFYSLSENTRHGVSRRPEECRAAFARLLDSPTHLERVLAAAKNNGGVERGIASACGIAHGIVSKYLRERGLRVEKLSGKLIPLDGPLSPERDARRELVAECERKGLNIQETAAALDISKQTVARDREALKAPAPEPVPDSPAESSQLGGAKELARAGESEPARNPEPAPTPTPAPPTPAPKRSLRDAAKGKPATSATTPPKALPSVPEMLVDELQKLVAAVAKKSEELLATTAGEKLRRLAKLNGVPFQVNEEHVVPNMPRVGDSLVKRVTSWPALESLQAVFGGIAAELAVEDYQRDAG